MIKQDRAWIKQMQQQIVGLFSIDCGCLGPAVVVSYMTQKIDLRNGKFSISNFFLNAEHESVGKHV